MAFYKVRVELKGPVGNYERELANIGHRYIAITNPVVDILPHLTHQTFYVVKENEDGEKKAKGLVSKLMKLDFVSGVNLMMYGSGD